MHNSAPLISDSEYVFDHTRSFRVMYSSQANQWPTVSQPLMVCLAGYEVPLDQAEVYSEGPILRCSFNVHGSFMVILSEKSVSLCCTPNPVLPTMLFTFMV